MYSKPHSIVPAGFYDTVITDMGIIVKPLLHCCVRGVE